MLFSTFPIKDSFGTGRNLEKTSWAEISTIAKTGKASKCFSIGDRKSLVVNGNTYCARIIGFNHDDLVSTDNYGTTTGGKAGITFDVKELLPDPAKYYSKTLPSDTYKISWGGGDDGYESTLRSETLPSIKTSLPTDLQSVIVPVKKVYLYYYSDSLARNTKTSNDELFLLSMSEMGLVGASSAYPEGEVYPFFDSFGAKATTFCRGLVIDTTGTSYQHLCRYFTRSIYGGFTSEGAIEVHALGIGLNSYNNVTRYGIAFDSSGSVADTYTNFSFCV